MTALDVQLWCCCVVEMEHVVLSRENRKTHKGPGDEFLDEYNNSRHTVIIEFDNVGLIAIFHSLVLGSVFINKKKRSVVSISENFGTKLVLSEITKSIGRLVECTTSYSTQTEAEIIVSSRQNM